MQQPFTYQKTGVEMNSGALDDSRGREERERVVRRRAG